MKNLILSFVLFIPFIISSQKGIFPLSTKSITANYDNVDFDKLNIYDFNGEIDVQIGKAYSIQLIADERIAPLFRIKQDKSEYRLDIYLENNKNGSAYIEDPVLKLIITMPASSVIRYKGNGDMNIDGVIGRYFRIEHEGNGDVEVAGNIDKLDIEKIGNGDTETRKLKAKTVVVDHDGNGNTTTYALIDLNIKGKGNGDILQYGPAKPSINSYIKGNGEILMK
jgi:hypothetical protein